MALFLKLLFLFLYAANQVRSEVDDGFSSCTEFFYKGTPPVVPATHPGARTDICQKYQNNYYFATGYSKHWRIPIFSAYKLPEPEDPARDCRTTPQPQRRNTWFVEPQLSGGHSENMDTAGHNTENYKDQQAINIDYSNTQFDRGHLNPNFYHCDNARTATFTLTNAVPQDRCFNELTWYDMEVQSKAIMRELCTFPGARRFFVTGVVPRNRMIPNEEHDLESDRLRDYNRVSVPSHMWTAACCDSSGATNPADQGNGFSFGYYGENKAKSFATTSSVRDLENSLTEIYNRAITIFVDDCNEASANSIAALEKINIPVSKMVANSAENVSNMRGSSVPLKKRKLTVETRKALNDAPGDWSLVNIDMGIRLDRYDVTDFRRTLHSSGLALVLIWTNSIVISPDNSPHTDLDEPTKFRYRNASSFKNAGGHANKRPGKQHRLNKKKQTWINDEPVKVSFNSSIHKQRVRLDKFGRPSAKKNTRKDTQAADSSEDEEDIYMVVQKRSKDITAGGDRCRQGHPCDFHGKDYQWCYTDWSKNWDYCCADECQRWVGADYTRCFAGTGGFKPCSIRSSMISIGGKRCLQDHECGLHGKGYYWCFTDIEGNWDYCCQPSDVCRKHDRESPKYCYVGQSENTKWKECSY